MNVYGGVQDKHRELAAQLCSEHLVEKMAGTTGEMFKWTRVVGTKNHFLDCAVGCMVGATLEGLRYGQEIEVTIRQAVGGTGQIYKPKRGGFRALET